MVGPARCTTVRASTVDFELFTVHRQHPWHADRPCPTSMAKCSLALYRCIYDCRHPASKMLYRVQSMQNVLHWQPIRPTETAKVIGFLRPPLQYVRLGRCEWRLYGCRRAAERAGECSTEAGVGLLFITSKIGFAPSEDWGSKLAYLVLGHDLPCATECKRACPVSNSLADILSYWQYTSAQSAVYS